MNDFLPGISQALNVHPLFVHFPIALWSFSLLLWVLGQFLGRNELLNAGRWTLYAGTLGALVTLGTGYLAADGIGHDSVGHDLVHVHRDFMLWSVGLGLLTTVVAFFLRNRGTSKGQWAVTLGLFLTVGLTTLGADRGALLVYRYGIGTRAAMKSHGEEGDHGEETEEAEAHEHGESSDPRDSSSKNDHHK